MTPAERDQLIDALLDQDISEADFLRLEAEMHIDESTRQAYYERLKLDTTLQVESESRSGDAGSESVSGTGFSRSNTGFGLLGWAAAAVLGVLAIVLGMEIHETNQADTRSNEEPVASGFGVVSEQSNTAWELDRGDLLPQGTIVLSDGIAELELFSGVKLIVQGHAEFEIVSANEILATHGNFYAQVPKLENNFRIKTGAGEIFNVEKEMTLKVPEQGKAVVSFAGSEFETQMAEQRAGQQKAWEDFVSELKQDSRLILYFPMTETENWNRQLIDHSPAKRNGAIVRATRSPDRWGHPFAGLDFTPTGSRVRVEIPGDHESLTLMCWVKIDSLDRWYNSLFLTDGHELHEPHWQIMDDGRLFFSVKANEPAKKGNDKHIAFSPPIWTPAHSGKWMHIATVFDGKAMTTTHYLNGEAISTDEIPVHLQPAKVRIGAASIGNWSDPTRGDDPHFAVRNLNGTIDEFAIFSAPLSVTEIREIYEVGKP